MKKKNQFVLAGIALALSGMSYAQVAPTAGQTLNDAQSKPLNIPQQQSLPLDIQAPQQNTAAGANAEAKLFVKAFEINGNSAIKTEVLLQQIADYTNKEITFAQLQEAANKIRQYYLDKGYPLVVSYIPAQEINQGVVRIAVLEGKYGQIDISNNGGFASNVTAPLTRLHAGDVVTSPGLDRALLLVNGTPGVEVKSVLRPGEKLGTSDVAMTLDKTKPYSGDVYFDNYGSKYSGQYRLGTDLSLNSPLKLGDRLDLSVMGTNESQYFGSAAYQLPVNAYGTIIGAGYSYVDYDLGYNYKSLDAVGYAGSTRLFVTQPLIVSRDGTLNTTLQYENKNLHDDMRTVDQRSKKKVNLITASVDGTLYDNILGGGVNRAILSLGYGDLSLDSADDQLVDAVTAKTAGHFKVMTLNALRLQRVTDKLSLYGRIQAQWANKNLNSSEKLGIGGVYSVRSYPQGEAQGDTGVLANMELRYQINPMWQTSLFYDAGSVKKNKSPWDNSDNRRTLTATGIGVQMNVNDFTVDAAVAYRLSSSEKITSTDDDHHYQFWLRTQWKY